MKEYNRREFLGLAVGLALVGCGKLEEKVKIETGFAEVNGTRLYYEVAGLGNPIVLIHGNLGDCRYWNDQFEVFAKSHKVIRYDVRGYGKSSLPVQGESYGDHDDLKALLGYLGISKAHIAGWSMGCVIAVDFVLAYPEMSNSLIAVGPWVSGFDSPAAEDLWEDFRNISSIAKESGPRAAAEFCITLLYVKPYVADRMKRIIYDYSFWHFINEDLRSFIDPPAIQQLDRLDLPTLIITAEYDLKGCREVADLLEQMVPNVEKVDFSDAGHVMLMEKSEEFNKIVLDFLKEIKD